MVVGKGKIRLPSGRHSLRVAVGSGVVQSPGPQGGTTYWNRPFSLDGGEVRGVGVGLSPKSGEVEGKVLPGSRVAPKV